MGLYEILLSQLGCCHYILKTKLGKYSNSGNESCRTSTDQLLLYMHDGPFSAQPYRSISVDMEPLARNLSNYALSNQYENH